MAHNHKTYRKNQPITVENSFELLILIGWFLRHVLWLLLRKMCAMIFIHKASFNQLKFALLQGYES